jgi:hypothetical protein
MRRGSCPWAFHLFRVQRILIFGSRPIVIGQAAEFDYSGTAPGEDAAGSGQQQPIRIITRVIRTLLGLRDLYVFVVGYFRLIESNRNCVKRCKALIYVPNKIS